MPIPKSDLQWQIGVDNVVEAGQEDTDVTEADEDTSNRRHSPMDVARVSGPAKPGCVSF